MQMFPGKQDSASGAALNGAPVALLPAKEEQARRNRAALAYLESEGVPGEVGDATPVGGEPWPDPEMLGGKLPEVEKLTLDILPASLRFFVVDIAARMQVPLDFPAVAAVATLAGVVGRRACIQPKERDPWRVVPNLWGGIVAEPGQFKSPVLSAVTASVKAIERKLVEEYEAATHEHALAAEQAELAKAVWKDNTRAELKRRETPSERPADPPAAPLQRRLTTQEVTPESLHKILTANPAGILILRDELTGLFALFEKPGREQLRGFCLEGWNGDSPFASDTIARGVVYVPHVCISIFGGIQPSRLRSYLAEALRGGPANDGLMQRFQLLVWPDPITSPRTYVDREPDAEAERQADAIYRRLAAMDAEHPMVFRFDPAAQELFREWLPGLENRCNAPEESEAMRAHLAKFRSLMPSLALLFALADGAEQWVSLCHATKAAAWCDYLETHARRVYSARATPAYDAAHTLGQALASGLLGKQGRQFTLRELYRKHWSGLDGKEECLPALAILEELGWVRKLPTPEKKTGRPTEAYAVNPNLEPRHAGG